MALTQAAPWVPLQEAFRPDTGGTVPGRRAWARVTQSGVAHSMVFEYSNGKRFYIAQWFPRQQPGEYMTVAPLTSDRSAWRAEWTAFKSSATLFEIDTIGIRAVRFPGSQDTTLYLLVKDGQPVLYPRPARCPSDRPCMNAPPPKVSVEVTALCS